MIGEIMFIAPEDADFTDCLLYNWIEKYAAVYGKNDAILASLKK